MFHELCASHKGNSLLPIPHRVIDPQTAHVGDLTESSFILQIASAVGLMQSLLVIAFRFSTVIESIVGLDVVDVF